MITGGGEGADVLVRLVDGGSHVGDHHIFPLVVFLEVQFGVVVDIADIFVAGAAGGRRREMIGGHRIPLFIERDHDGAADGRGVVGHTLAQKRTAFDAGIRTHRVGPEGELGEGGARAGLPAAAPGRRKNGLAVAVGIQALGRDLAAGRNDLAAFGHPAFKSVTVIRETVFFIAGEGLIAGSVDVADRNGPSSVDLLLPVTDDGGKLAVKAAFGLRLNNVINDRQRAAALLVLIGGLFHALFRKDFFDDGLLDDGLLDDGLFGGGLSGGRLLDRKSLKHGFLGHRAIGSVFFNDLIGCGLRVGINESGGAGKGKNHDQHQEHRQFASELLHFRSTFLLRAFLSSCGQCRVSFLLAALS